MAAINDKIAAELAETARYTALDRGDLDLAVEVFALKQEMISLNANIVALTIAVNQLIGFVTGLAQNMPKLPPFMTMGGKRGG